jgi:hypothetical protein
VVHTHDGVRFSHNKNKILSFLVKQIELQVIMLSEIGQTHKDEYCMFSLI